MARRAGGSRSDGKGGPSGTGLFPSAREGCWRRGSEGLRDRQPWLPSCWPPGAEEAWRRGGACFGVERAAGGLAPRCVPRAAGLWWLTLAPVKRAIATCLPGRMAATPVRPARHPCPWKGDGVGSEPGPPARRGADRQVGLRRLPLFRTRLSVQAVLPEEDPLVYGPPADGTRPLRRPCDPPRSGPARQISRVLSRGGLQPGPGAELQAWGWAGRAPWASVSARGLPGCQGAAAACMRRRR